MIPQEVIDLANSSYVATIGSRDEHLAPTLRNAWGINIKASEDIVTSFVVEAQFEQMLKNFRQNGRMALSFSDSLMHVCYQLKGHFLQARPLTKDEVALQQQYRRRMINSLIEWGFPEERVNIALRPVDLAIDFKVEKIFNQTPGPGAGKEIAF